MTQRLFVSIGGRHFRTGLFDVSTKSMRATLRETELTNGNVFATGREWAEFVGNNIPAKLPRGQRELFISSPGPLSPSGLEMVKFVGKQADGAQAAPEMNIPFANIIREKYQQRTGKPLNILLVPDSTTAAWAVANSGRLTGAAVGTGFNAVILGGGFGGSDYDIIRPGVPDYRDGGFEFGHWNAYWDLLRRSGLSELLPNSVECGCGQVGNRKERTPVCAEAVVAGPGLTRLGRAFFSKLRLLSASPSLPAIESRNGGKLAGLPMTEAELRSNALFKATLTRLGETAMLTGDIAAAKSTVAKKFLSDDFTEALRQSEGQEFISKRILSGAGLILANRLADSQRFHQKKMHYVFVGGAGVNLWPYFSPALEAEISAMASRGGFPKWCNGKLSVNVDTNHPDELDLHGVAYYWLHKQGKK